MRITQILETTTAGSVATVAQPMMTQTRESVDVPGLKPVQQVMKGKAKKKGPYANSISEGKVKELSIDLKELTDADFKKKYGKTKAEIRASMKKEVTEDDLSEQDLIIIPGQGRLRKTGFVKHDLDQGEHEGHTLKNSLHTIARAASDLDKRLSVQSEFPEWVSEKIGAAKGMMVSVMDYLISSQEMQHDRDDMNEGSQRVDSLVTDALRVMKGPEISDAVLALKRVLGDRAYNERRGFYNFYIDQIHDMYNQQNINELSSGLLGRAAQAATDKRNQAMEPELHAALGGGYMNPLAKHYDKVSQKIDNRAAQVRNKETIQKNASKIASPAVMRKMGITEGDVSTGNLQTMYNLARMAKNYCSDPEGKEALIELLRILKWYMDQGSEQGVAEGLGKQIHGTFQSMGDSFGDAHLAKGISYFLQGRHQEGENMLRSKIPEKAQNIVFSKLKTLQAQSGLDVNKNPNIQKYIDDELVPWVKRQIQQGVTEGKIDFAKKLQGKVDKHNKAVVKTKQAVGSRVVDIGAGGKEHNEKTDAAWDAAKKKVSEGSKK